MFAPGCATGGLAILALDAMAGIDTNRGAKRARELRAELGLAADRPLDCLLTLVEQRLGIAVIVAALPAEVDGACCRDGPSTVLLVNGTHVPVRRRFTLAHELGHLRCGHQPDTEIRVFTTVHGKETTSLENQANAFAAELLAPADFVRVLAGARSPQLADCARIGAACGISSQSALYRLNTLGLAGDGYAQMRATLNGDLTERLRDDLGLPEYPDAIAAIGPADLPRLSPSLAGSALAAMIAGRISAASAARAASVDPAVMAGAAGLIGV